MNTWYPSFAQLIKIALSGRKWVNFMHVSKTAGTAVKTALKGNTITSDYAVLLHGHWWTLKHLRANQKVVFFMRDPITRYVSAFYSRYRKGRPRFDHPWSHAEAVAFEKFMHPCHLAEALSSSIPEMRQDAIQAMRSIGHVRSFVSRWLISPDHLQSKIDQILFIGFQENLEQDFQKLKAILGLSDDLRLPSNDFDTHRTPLSMDKTISDLARRNLEIWYKDDFILYDLCKRIYAERFHDGIDNTYRGW